MTLDLTSLRLQLREGLGLEGDDTATLPNTDTSDKTGADTYLNRAYWEVLDRFKFREKEVIATFPTTQGEDFYKIPSPFEAIQGLSIEDPDSFAHTPLDRITADEFEQTFVNKTDAEDKPTNYFREADGIRLYPRPDQAYTVTIRHWTLLSDLSSTNTVPAFLQKNFHEIILFGGLWRAFIGVNGDWTRSQAARAVQSGLLAGVHSTDEKEQADSHRAGVEVAGYEGEL